jgi:hypothetical protein
MRADFPLQNFKGSQDSIPESPFFVPGIFASHGFSHDPNNRREADTFAARIVPAFGADAFDFVFSLNLPFLASSS